MQRATFGTKFPRGLRWLLKAREKESIDAALADTHRPDRLIDAEMSAASVFPCDPAHDPQNTRSASPLQTTNPRMHAR